MQPLMLATSNLVHNLGLGLGFQKKQRLGPKLAGGLGQGSIRKNLGPPIYFCNRLKKLVHNRFTLQNTSFRTKLGRVILVAVVQQVVDLCLFPVRFQ